MDKKTEEMVKETEEMVKETEEIVNIYEIKWIFRRTHSPRIYRIFFLFYKINIFIYKYMKLSLNTHVNSYQ